MKSDAAFVDDYEHGVQVCKKVVVWMKSKGVEAKVMKQKLRPDSAVRWQYRDGGDILIERCIWEVKGRNLNFNSVATFPFPTVYVNECYKHRDSIKGYIIVNNDCNGFLFVLSTTKPHWVMEKDKWIDDQNRFCDSWLCPKELFRYRRMT